ncbi:hypothetical protein JXA12_03925 [Candidatus Woesearchaeota archaeon]|nr:hypothetical protein [Candidatus Woesearchaeota archaeon]
MAREGWFLRIVIFALLWVIGAFFFGSYGGSIGTYGSMIYIGNTILGSSLSEDGGSIATLIISFIITAAIYYIIAEIVTLVLTRVFGRSE